MATEPKRWPTNAEWAREDSIVLSDRVVAALRPLLEDPKVEMSVLRAVSQAIDAAHQIRTKLTMVGPKS